MDTASQFERHRAAIESLAYRMLGSFADAEDIAQETWLRWNRQGPGEHEHTRSWFLKTASRLALDRLKSARAHREQYVGPWLPEPWLVDDRSPADAASVDESVTIALLLAMERLTPGERAAFLLHDVFDFSFDEIAEVLGKRPATCRQLASRARVSIRGQRPCYDLDARLHREMLNAFAMACRTGDLNGLKGLLRDDVVVVSDSNGKARAARKLLRTSDIAARLFHGIFRKARNRGHPLTLGETSFNGLPGLVLRESGAVVGALGIAVSNGRIARIFFHRNPEKLSRL